MANLEVLALDTTVPQIRAPGTGDGYAVPRDMTLSAGTTLTAPTVNATTFDTNVAAAGVTLTGTTLAADGTDTNIPINVTPKGTGTVVVSPFGVTVNGTTPSILSNDGSGLVITQSATDKIKVRGVGSLGENTSFQVGEGNTAAQPNITFINDPDTGLFNNSVFSPNKLFLVAGGVEYVSTATAATVVNDGGADHDFRVEGDTQANLFICDASSDRIGSNIAAPAVNVDFRAATQHTMRIGTTAISGVSANFANIEYYWSDEDAAGVKIELKADMVGNVGPGGGAATDLLINTYNVSGNALTTVARFKNDQSILFPGVYDDTVGATNRDLFIDDTGKIGYVSSIRASKTNIADLNSPSWLLQLNPVSFNYRKKDENGKYTDEAEAPLEYGLIAEDTEAVNPELCFYDIVDGKPELRGVHYSKLMTPILKLVQEQQKAIASLQAEVAELKAR